ncbi:DUF1622 domain-containing protein [Rufibacter latericius]|uniref:DUF1622 domain-containing protein n=1 Tax=Rufibacter latericius TaxID=2487040 RepID=A0A3M9MZK5_9BACT|nr:DUF1622 domain-containing protein [Rufibacter latericius]RNI30575.1 DUF1622 domain-containing protein [Rufibacter latericius]
MYYLLQAAAASSSSETNFGRIEETIIQGVQALKLFIETIGALIIGVGVLIALFYIVKGLVPPQVESYNKIRLVLARYLALALEFQLGADILSTAIAPSWDQIGKLGAIAVIRTALNYFLAMEMKEERSASEDPKDDRSMVPEPQDKPSPPAPNKNL